MPGNGTRDEVVMIGAARTLAGRSGKGLSQLAAGELGAAASREAGRRTGLPDETPG